MRFETINASQFLVYRLDYARAVKSIRDEGDIILLNLQNDEQVMILFIERGMNLNEVRHYYADNSSKGIHTLMILWVDMFLPRDGQTYLLNDWMQVLVALHGDKMYGYEVAGRDAFFFPVHMLGKGRERRVRYGNIINYAAIGGAQVNTLNPYMPGKWYVGGFEHTKQTYRTTSTTDTRPLLAYYDVLGLPLNADLDAIKRAYRTLARLYHPDVNDAHDADDRMKRINRAYTKIMNEKSD